VFTEEITAICLSEYELNIWNAQVWADGTWHSTDEYKWDLLFTREAIARDYPFLLKMGELTTLPVEVAQYSPGYGALVLIRNDED
jgi:hypothetical protein